MALVVEDGTGIPTAESYSSVAEVAAYVALYDITGWDSNTTTDEKEVALRKATSYLDLVYGKNYKGSRNTKTQGLKWPRTGAVVNEFEVEDNEIPKDLKTATMIVAVKMLNGEDFLPDLDSPEALIRERVKIGPIEVDETYAGGKGQYKRYTEVEELMEGLTIGMSGDVAVRG